MFITRQSPNSRENAPVSARRGCPYADTTQERGRVTSDCERDLAILDRTPPCQGTVGGLPPTPMGRDQRSFSRHAFLCGALVLTSAPIV